jgi:hypothetical protein
MAAAKSFHNGPPITIRGGRIAVLTHKNPETNVHKRWSDHQIYFN